MGRQQPEGGRSVDADGVTRVEQPRAGVGTWLVGLAALFTVGCIALSVWLTSSRGATEEVPPPEVGASPPTPSVARSTSTAPVRVAPRPSAPPVAEPAAVPGAEPEPEDFAEALGKEPMEEKTGLALFVPGTKPIKKGIVVPDGFELPPGHMRHYQTTDDGQMLEPILMFHPDYQPLDANGQPVALPENRVVPAEMAPPGLPIKLLEVPERTPEPRP
jgi:hypothetical protein